MSTLEKFGILVILILVVIIGVVAVWGVGGNEGANPFESGSEVATTPEPAAPSGQLPSWPAPATTAPAVPTVAAPVAPPPVDAPATAPSAPAAAKAEASLPADDGTTYVVKKGDTLTKIARETLGDGNRYQEILGVNPGLDPKRLKIGMKIRIPGSAGMALAPAAPKPPVSTFANPDDGPTGAAPTAPEAAAAGVREVVVEDGDSYWKLAERYLGDGNLYPKIVKLNPNVDAKRLRKGMTIRIPAAE